MATIPPRPNATISDGVQYIQKNPSALFTIYAGIKELITVIFLIFKPGIKSPTPYGK